MATSAGLAVDPGRDRWVACLPLAHIGGLSVVTRALDDRHAVTVLERFDAERVEERGPAGRHPRVPGGHRPRPARHVAVPGRPAGRRRPARALPGNVVTTYGMTETGSGCVYDGTPLDGVEVRIGDGSFGADGEILVRGPMLLRAYRDGTDPELGRRLVPDRRRRSASRHDGTLVVYGRMAEVIVTGAEKVWPVAVEHVLAATPGWPRSPCGSGPTPSGASGWWPGWSLRPGAPPALDELRELVAAQVAPWAAPRELVVVDALPRTPGGKVRRADLT